MRNKLMAGVWRYIVGVPPFLWEKQIEKSVAKVKRATGFMTPEHRLVHHFVVREMSAARQARIRGTGGRGIGPSYGACGGDNR